MANATRVESWGPSNHVWKFHCQLMLLVDNSTGILFMGRMNICIDSLLFMVPIGSSISLFNKFAISFIILYSIVKLISFLPYFRFYLPAKFMYHSCYIVIFLLILFGISCSLSLHFFNIWDIFIWYRSHATHTYIRIVNALGTRRPPLWVHVGTC